MEKYSSIPALTGWTTKVSLRFFATRWPYEHAQICCCGNIKKSTFFLIVVIFSFVFLHAFICSAVSHPVDRWTLGVLELHWTLPEHHLQHPAVRGDQCFRTGGWLDRRRTEPCWDPARPTDLVLHVLTRPSFSWLWSTLDLWPAPLSQPQGSSSPSSAQFFCLATPWALCSGPAPSWSS